MAAVAGISAFVGFGATLSTAKKTDPKYFNKGNFLGNQPYHIDLPDSFLLIFLCFQGLHGSPELADAGAILALRALGWGTVYAITGTTCLCYGIWKLSGAKNVSNINKLFINHLKILSMYLLINYLFQITA